MKTNYREVMHKLVDDSYDFALEAMEMTNEPFTEQFPILTTKKVEINDREYIVEVEIKLKKINKNANKK